MTATQHPRATRPIRSPSAPVSRLYPQPDTGPLSTTFPCSLCSACWAEQNIHTACFSLSLIVSNDRHQHLAFFLISFLQYPTYGVIVLSFSSFPSFSFLTLLHIPFLYDYSSFLHLFSLSLFSYSVLDTTRPGPAFSFFLYFALSYLKAGPGSESNDVVISILFLWMFDGGGQERTKPWMRSRHVCMGPVSVASDSARFHVECLQSNRS